MENLKVKDLKALARKKGIKGYYRMRKAELIQVLTPVGDPSEIYYTANDQSIPEVDILIFTPSKKPINAPQKPVKVSYSEELISALKENTNDKSEPIFVIREIESDQSVPFENTAIRCSDPNIIPYNGFPRCPHGKDKPQCKECGGWRICTHGKFKPYCRECKGSQICTHGRNKHQCKDCEGSQICPHNRVIYNCKDCIGCTHGRLKKYCKECKGSRICEHNRVKYTCKDCGGKGICQHGKNKRYCKDCGGSGICSHGKNKPCKDCPERKICPHLKYKHYCEECNKTD